MSLLSAAESYGLPSSSTPMSPATSDAQSSSSHTAGTAADSAAEEEADSAVDSAAAAEEEAGDLESASVGISQANEGHSSAGNTQSLQSSSSHAEALTVLPLEEGKQISAAVADHTSPPLAEKILGSIATAVCHTSSPLGESAGDVSCLDSFLHTVTTADQVLNDLLGELPSSSASPSLSRQSSSLAGVTANPLALASGDAADGVFQSSSSPVQLGIYASSSAAAVESKLAPSDLNSPRPTTDAVLDSLLEDLRSAELTRHSSSSALLSRLNSLAELRRRSASSSPVARTSQVDIHYQPSSSAELPVPRTFSSSEPPVHQPSSSAELPVYQPSSSAVHQPSPSELPVLTVNCSSADRNASSASSSHSANGITCSSSSPVTLAAGRQLHASSSDNASSSPPPSSYEAWRKPDEEEIGKDCDRAAAPAVVKDAWEKEGLSREEEGKLQTVTTSDLVLDELLDDAQVALEPDSTANQVKLPPKVWHGGRGGGLVRSVRV